MRDTGSRVVQLQRYALCKLFGWAVISILGAKCNLMTGSIGSSPHKGLSFRNFCIEYTTLSDFRLYHVRGYLISQKPTIHSPVSSIANYMGKKTPWVIILEHLLAGIRRYGAFPRCVSHDDCRLWWKELLLYLFTPRSRVNNPPAIIFLWPVFPTHIILQFVQGWCTSETFNHLKYLIKEHGFF